MVGAHSSILLIVRTKSVMANEALDKLALITAICTLIIFSNERFRPAFGAVVQWRITTALRGVTFPPFLGPRGMQDFCKLAF